LRTVNYLAELHIADSKITNPKIYTYKNRAMKWQESLKYHLNLGGT